MTVVPDLERIRGVKAAPWAEYYTSGHRTCQGCDSAIGLRYIAKAAGPRSIVNGATGCMYVANTSYYCTPWVVPWMHTQLGAAGSSALGNAAGIKAQMKKGKIKEEAINIITIAGDGGAADMGLSAISATLTWPEYNCLILMYDNESYANTDVQVSGTTPFGAATTFSPTGGKVVPILHRRWKKNMPGLIMAGHPDCRYVATATTGYPIDLMNKVRKALSIGGPTFIQTLNPCPKGWDFDPKFSREMAELACKTGMWALYEMVDGKLTFNPPTAAIARKQQKRLPVRDYLQRQGRFHHFTDKEYNHVQKRIDEVWDSQKWSIPGVLPFYTEASEIGK